MDNIKILNNGMQIIYGNDTDNLINIGINNFGITLSIFHKRYKLIHFIEHIIVLLLINYTGSLSFWNAYTNISHMVIYYNNIINLSHDKIIKAIIKLFDKNGNIYIDNNIITNDILQNENIILENEKNFRLLSDAYNVNPILYLLTNDAYLEGTDKKLDISVKYINNILKTINPKDIIFYTSNLDFFNNLSINLDKIIHKNKDNYNDYYLEFPIIKSKLSNSILLFSFVNNVDYKITIKFDIIKYAIVGYIMDKYYFNKNIIINIFYNKTLSITQCFATSEDMYKSIFNKFKILDKIKYFYLSFDDYILLHNYIDIVNMYKDIINNNISKYLTDYNKYIEYIKKSTLDINNFFLQIPNKIYLNNEHDINNIPVYKSETIFDNKIDLSNTVYKYSNYNDNIEIVNLNPNNILFFLNSNEDKFSIQKNNILLSNPKHVYKLNSDTLYTLNNNYIYPKILFYYKYFILYFLSNQFLDIENIIYDIKYKTKFNLIDNYKKYNFNIYDKIILNNSIIKINTDYNFVAVFYSYKYISKLNDYIHIRIISDILRKHGLIYSPMENFDGNFIYLFLITKYPIKTEKYTRELLHNKFNITNIITIISTKNKLNVDNLLNKYICFE
ncbi:metalloprotease (Cop-G1L) [Adoxophyes honmai entomopoxvirus 'L']|uniref:Metalloprotease (Cop-G1L) n=1 Tax=Adoxophyes honmai entomopoxvirus 'L' TaxID=1293540 RepID=A0A916KPE1_9POXV|nr:metalloprotease (Cop-G1L) [Adoxophyes honmai entomopoxvirus 'L']CCU55552.1 metalloprotease (Cop-G1L) [Adoxophyes honmai entomopoxvirus 'L']